MHKDKLPMYNQHVQAVLLRSLHANVIFLCILSDDIATISVPCSSNSTQHISCGFVQRKAEKKPGEYDSTNSTIYSVCMHYLTIRLRARHFYEVIVDEGEARINYHLIEIKSE